LSESARFVNPFYPDLQALLSELERRRIHVSSGGQELVVRAPRGALDEGLRLELVRRKPELLALLGREQERAAGLEPLAPDPDRWSDPFPLTEMQSAYYVGRQPSVALGGTSCYFYCEYEGSGLDVERLEHAWQRLVARHGMLRAVVGADSLQRILPEVPPYRIEVVDLGSLRGPELDAALVARRDLLAHQVRPPEQWPLFDLRATRFGAGRVRVHIGFDLMAVDALSMFLLVGEWRTLYEAPATELPPLALSFRDFAVARVGFEQSPAYARARDYWITRMDALPGPPELPAAPGGASFAMRFQRRAARLATPDWEALKRRAAAEGLTPSNVLAAAFARVLGQWSRGERFTLNLTLFNRPPVHPQIGALVGDLSSTLLVEVDDRPASFLERATRFQAQLLRDLEHQDFSGVRVLGELAVRGRRQLAPIVFTSTLGHGALVGDSPYVWSWLGEQVYAITQTPQVTLDHQVFEDRGALLFNWDVVEEAYPPGLVADMFEAYVDLLGRLARDGSAWHGPEPSLLPAADRARRQAANATEASIPELLLHEPFESRVRSNPAAPAVLSLAGEIVYGELDRRAAGVAAALARLGIRPGTVVPVVLEKGWEQVAAVLGIGKAGCAYLPVDPDLPANRRRYLIEQSASPALVTTAALDQALEWPEVRRVVIEQASDERDAPPPLRQQTPSDLAYVIFTSGSTGLPKGVMIDHRGAANTLIDVNQRFAVSELDRVLALSALSFDLSVYDVFGTLAAGAAIVMPSPEGARDPAHWFDLMTRHGVTIWNSAPALMELQVQHCARRGLRLPSSLRLVMLSGDWIPTDLPAQIRALGCTAEIVSLGGATEASIWSILYPIGAVDPAWASIPYGRPMRNQRFHVLDDRLEPCPTWVPGELYIGGDGLARGYLNDEARTRERFIVHPATGERLYRTGDLGRYLPDGNLEFLGREDAQVKIQGFRIELGEVETALRQHAAVRDAVVVAQGQARGSRRWLAAFVVPERAAPVPDPAKAAFQLAGHGLRRWPAEWPALDLPSRPGEAEARYTRRSHRRFDAAPVSLTAFGAALDCLRALRLPEQPLPRYLYPSAGALYPVQVYVHVRPDRVEGVEAGGYGYDPMAHRLVRITPGARFDAEWHYEPNRPIFEESAFSIFLIAQTRAIAPAYGEVARDLCLLEAGYIGQLLQTSAAEAGVGLCPIGAVTTDPLRGLFDLDDGHLFLHAFECGGIPPAGAAAPRDLASELRAFLESRLPRHMVPPRITLLEALPLTSNGKVDRKRLAETESAAAGAERYQAPDGDLERAIERLVAEELGLARVSSDANFFELGRTSIELITLGAKLSDRLGRSIPAVAIFQYPTIRALAAYLAGSADGATEGEVDRARARGAARRRRTDPRAGGEGGPPDG
jgi:epothilone synthetase B